MSSDSLAEKNCPPYDVLVQFSRGELQDGLEMIAEHLSSCSICESEFERIDSDTIDDCFREVQTRSNRKREMGRHSCSALAPGRWSEFLARSGERHVDDQPDQIGRFKVERRLGVGGFGQVLLAHDSTLHRSVAIKLPHRNRLQSPEQRQAFLREGQILAKLDHPGLVSVFDVAETNEGQLYLVMEFIDGPSLSHALDSNGLSYEQRISIANSVVEALGAAHQQGLVHRDLKPSNILLRADGQAVIVDFGLASEIKSNEQQELCGTPPYMSPELLSGTAKQASEVTDIWSLGVTLYRLLSGHRPYTGQTVSEVLEQIETHPPRPLSTVTSQVPDSISRVVMKCLQGDPSKRYQSVADVRSQLKHATSKLVLKALVLVVVTLVALTATAFGVKEYQSKQTIENLLAAELTSLPPLTKRVKADTRIQSKLATLIDSGSLTAEQELRARLAQCESNHSLEKFIEEKTPAQCVAIAQCISGTDRAEESARSIVTELGNAELDDGRFLRLATILALLNQDRDWSPNADRIVRSINQELPRSMPAWFAPFRADGAEFSSQIVDILAHEYEPKRRMTFVRELSKWSHQFDQIGRAVYEVDLTPGEFNLLRPALQRVTDKDAFCDRIQTEIHNRLHATPEAAIEDDVVIGSRTTRLRNLVLALNSLGRRTMLWQRLNDRNEPSLRTSLIHGLAEAGVAASILVERLADQDLESLERGGIILALAEYTTGKDKLAQLFAELYEHDPDAYVHSAARFGLVHFGRSTWREKLDASVRPKDARWIKKHDLTFVRVDRGEENPYVVGSFSDLGTSKSPSGAASSFHFSTTPVSIEQFRIVVPDRQFTPKVSDEKMPATRLDSLYYQDALRYCVELSKLEGLTEDEWCYEYVERDGAQVLRPKSDFLKKQGYRLPTDAEYAFAASGGIVAKRYFGDVSYYANYEWRNGNSGGQRRRPAELRPNPFGIFDALGNVKCVCQDNLTDYGKLAKTDPRFVSISEDFQCFVGYDVFSARGGMYLESVDPTALSVTHHFQSEDNVDFPVGFRVVKTISLIPSNRRK